MTSKLQPEPVLTSRLVITRHLLVWCLFIVYESGSVFLATGQYGHLLDYLLFYSLNIGVFYVNSNFTLPLAFGGLGSRWLIVTGLIMTEIIFYLLIKFSLDFLLATLRHAPHIEISRLGSYLIRNLWRGSFFIGASTLYWSALRSALYREAVAAAEKRELTLLMEQTALARNLAEIHNAYLQQQINPHFLFNALNFIYNSFYKVSKPAATCVSKLADILRYSLQTVGSDGKADLTDEIEQIENLIELNRQRFRFPLFVKMEVHGQLEGLKITPLILLTFIENIFKHGNLKEEKEVAVITISIEEGQLRYHSRNLKKVQAASVSSENIGLANTVKRLGYTYPGNYQLQVEDDEEFFEVDLRINL